MCSVTDRADPDGRVLLVTDAVLNIKPSMRAKRDIVQNAIDLARAIGVELPKAAILSAVETISPKLSSPLMPPPWPRWPSAARFDRRPGRRAAGLRPARWHRRAARIRGILTPRSAGEADILVVPDLESGNMLAKQLDHFAESQAAGIVLGARVPIAITGRADSRTVVALCALATLVARAPAEERAAPEGGNIDQLVSPGFRPDSE